MNIRYKVYYHTKEQVEAGEIYPATWKSTLPSKLIRAKNPEKAMEIFKHKHPDLVPVTTSLY